MLSLVVLAITISLGELARLFFFLRFFFAVWRAPPARPCAGLRASRTAPMDTVGRRSVFFIHPLLKPLARARPPRLRLRPRPRPQRGRRLPVQ